ncbi:PEPxxWA-CTERM sorting domain-containing protein, partial [Sphingomonas sp.]|uniref:PEPxxWA-CTERM sorting domain-containing protein n=1 Tax=Sphingomonas sp. TaxID=28214 RepID=UPI002DBC6B0C
RTDAGDLITAVSFDTSGSGVGDIRQVRLGAFAGAIPSVPEPATWAMMIAGFGLIGGALRRRARATLRFA